MNDCQKAKIGVGSAIPVIWEASEMCNTVLDYPVVGDIHFTNLRITLVASFKLCLLTVTLP